MPHTAQTSTQCWHLAKGDAYGDLPVPHPDIHHKEDLRHKTFCVRNHHTSSNQRVPRLTLVPVLRELFQNPSAACLRNACNGGRTIHCETLVAALVKRVRSGIWETPRTNGVRLFRSQRYPCIARNGERTPPTNRPRECVRLQQGHAH